MVGRPRPRLAVLTVLAVAFLVVAGSCGGDGGTGGGVPTANAAIEAALRVAAVPAGAPEIDQDGLRFSPTALTVKAGETVYFKNSESAVHTVTVNGTNVSGTMKRGEIVAWRVPAPGVYRVTCDFHPQMRAALTAQ